MSQPPIWVPDGVDTTRPSAARVYDYYLGGFHNFAVDRQMAEQAIAMWPDLPRIMKANRGFLRRAVTALVDRGVRQFLDVGSGIPTVGSVHEVAQAIDPRITVVYVDIDPVAVAHSRAILADNPNATAMMADLRDPESILRNPAVRELIDFDQPMGLLLIALLHFVPDDAQAATSIAALRDAGAPGSYLALSHAGSDLQDPDLSASHQALYRQTATPMRMRERDAVLELFQGYDLVPPGLVELNQWSDGSIGDWDPDHRAPAWAGVGCKA